MRCAAQDILHTMRARGSDSESAASSSTAMWAQLLRMDGPPPPGKEMVGPAAGGLHMGRQPQPPLLPMPCDHTQ